MSVNSSSRAVITLLDSGHDLSKGDFPSFCTLHLTIRDREKNPKLDCLAYFRKQEMRYWWPVNITELHKIQKNVADRLIMSSNMQNLVCGCITTVAAIAVVSSGMPKVGVPLVDRLFDLDRDRLWDMAYGSLHPNARDRAKNRGDWDLVLDDLTPSEGHPSDGGPVALGGLKYLHAEIAHYAEQLDSGAGRDLSNALLALYKQNDQFLKDHGSEDPAKYSSWREETLDNLQLARGRLHELFSEIVHS